VPDSPSPAELWRSRVRSRVPDSGSIQQERNTPNRSIESEPDSEEDTGDDEEGRSEGLTATEEGSTADGGVKLRDWKDM